MKTKEKEKFILNFLKVEISILIEIFLNFCLRTRKVNKKVKNTKITIDREYSWQKNEKHMLSSH